MLQYVHHSLSRLLEVYRGIYVGFDLLSAVSRHWPKQW